MTEPLIHSQITDVLPEDHPQAYDTLYCTGCREMVHAGNNECMQIWVETGKGPYCVMCFVEHYDTVDEEDWALPLSAPVAAEGAP